MLTHRNRWIRIIIKLEHCQNFREYLRNRAVAGHRDCYLPMANIFCSLLKSISGVNLRKMFHCEAVYPFLFEFKNPILLTKSFIQKFLEKLNFLPLFCLAHKLQKSSI